ncbi:hypothetical protein BGY98DRAFT_914655 [Russula aff. rugulosa BPL654]|nr:hypothetical protein BGY98DRAFT_914655 [Russula aff. rugulosa BPL654]
MHARTSTKEREARISELEAEVAELQKELGLGEDAQQIVSRHIKLLHRYNEAKDATQVPLYALLSYIHKQTTIRQTHEDYGLTDDD